MENTKIDTALCAYIADYIQEELNRGCGVLDIDKYLISMAVEAYQGGAAIGEDNEEWSAIAAPLMNGIMLM